MTSAVQAHRGIKAAVDDLRHARHSEEGGFHAHACFSSQQAAEKAVKAVHYARGARAVMGHSVRNLISKCTGLARSAWMMTGMLLVLTGGQACGILEVLEVFDENLACPALTPPGIRVDVVDASSGRPVPHAANPTGSVTRGRVREPMSLVPVATGEDHIRFEGAHGPAGIYDAEIIAEGYEPWRASGISVQVDRCRHPTRTVKMIARLLPATPTA